jgi:hypothetical protein
MSVELEAKIKELEKSNAYLQGRLDYYEQDGIAKLFYSLKRKANEMADLLNNTKLTDIDIDEPKSKTFERLQKIWEGAATIAGSVKSLEVLSGIKPEEKDTDKKETIVVVQNRPLAPEMIADRVGELAGAKKV